MAGPSLPAQLACITGHASTSHGVAPMQHPAGLPHPQATRKVQQAPSVGGGQLRQQEALHPADGREEGVAGGPAGRHVGAVTDQLVDWRHTVV